MIWLHDFMVKRSVAYRWLYQHTKRISLPGFQKVPIASVLGNFYKSLEKDDITSRASSLAFNFFLALFPAVIFFFTLIAFVPIQDLHASIMQKISELIPKAAYESVSTTIEDILKNQHGGLLSFGFFTALLLSSNALFNMFKAFNKYDQAIEPRSVFHRRWLSLLLTILLSVFFILSTLLITVGQHIIDYLAERHFLTDWLSIAGLNAIKWGATILIFYTVIACLYYFGSSLKRKFKFISAGTSVASLGCIAATYGFSQYVNNFNSYNKLYGSIGTLLIVLLLIYFNSLMILYGYELNTSIEKAARDHIKPADMTVSDLEISEN